jgi:hypothetical protein
MRRTILLAALAVSGCTTDATPQKEKVVETPTKLAGVYPERFECTTIATADALEGVLGSPTRAIDSPSSVPRGLPRPCTYEVAANPPEYWTFDFDCRDGYKKRADDLFAQYRKYNADRIVQYNTLADAGVPKAKPVGDAGAPELHHPGLPTDVEVGAKALDHNDQGLIFIDDDAPCYVRIIGPEATRRLALAKLIAKNLSFANAPMTPRPFPK